ncbi:MAG: O-antigen ligase family protein, partial [Candidatus Korobacteraceae bacterium]
MSSRTLVVIPGREASPRTPRRPSARMEKILAAGLAIVLMFGVAAFGAVEEWSGAILQCASLFVFLLWGLSHWMADEPRIQTSPLLAPVLAFAALVALQLVFGLTAYRYATAQEALRYCAYGMLLFVALQVLERREALRWFLFLLVAFGFIMALLAILQDFTAGGKLYWLRQPRFPGSLYGPYVNRNHWAGFAEMLAPLPLAFAAGSRMAVPQKVLFGFVTALIAATIFLSGSRGGMLALGVQIVAGLLLILANRSVRRHVISGSIVLLAVLALAIWLGGGKLATRAATLLDSETISQDMRLSIARDSLQMVQARPFFGWGLDTFVTVYPQFRSFVTTKFVNSAHNDYLQLLVETGVIGFFLMLWFLVVLFRSALRGWDSGLQGRARIAALVGCIGIL